MSTFRQSGFSMIEVLISVFVLALGVIGAAGLQLTALKSNQESAVQTAAIQLATEMADKIRMNATQMQVTDSKNKFLFDYDSAGGSALPEPNKLCYVGTECNSIELADFDVYQFKRAVRDNFPGGRVKICRDAAPEKTAGEGLTWDCTPAAGKADSIPIVIKIGWRGRESYSTVGVLPNIFTIVGGFAQ